MIVWVLNVVSVRVFPPPTAQIPRLARTEFGLAVDQKLERSFHWQRVFDNERAEVLVAFEADQVKLNTLLAQYADGYITDDQDRRP